MRIWFILFLFGIILFFGKKQQDFTEHKRKRKLVNYNFGFPSQPGLMGDFAAFIFVWSCDPVMIRFLRFFFGSVSPPKFKRNIQAKNSLLFYKISQVSLEKIFMRKICDIY
jgi:hypothetical protein